MASDRMSLGGLGDETIRGTGSTRSRWFAGRNTSVHALAQIRLVSVEHVMGEDHLAHPIGVNLPEAPSLEPPREAFKLGLAEIPRQDGLDEFFLVGDAERSSRRQPGDRAATELVA